MLKAGAAVLCALLSLAVSAAPRALARDVLRELVEISTTESSGNVTAAAQAALFGLRVFQVGGDACEVDDHREHRHDERIGVEAFARGVDYYYRFPPALLGKH